MSAREGRSEEPVKEENLPHRLLYGAIGFIGRPRGVHWHQEARCSAGSQAQCGHPWAIGRRVGWLVQGQRRPALQ
jgi:hypothetical protein